MSIAWIDKEHIVLSKKWVEQEENDLEDWLKIANAASKLLQEAHDKMDDYNASRAIAGCRWCHVEGYDPTGLKHGKDCILIKIRKFLGGY